MAETLTPVQPSGRTGKSLRADMSGAPVEKMCHITLARIGHIRCADDRFSARSGILRDETTSTRRRRRDADRSYPTRVSQDDRSRTGAGGRARRDDAARAAGEAAAGPERPEAAEQAGRLCDRRARAARAERSDAGVPRDEALPPGRAGERSSGQGEAGGGVLRHRSEAHLQLRKLRSDPDNPGDPCRLHHPPEQHARRVHDPRHKAGKHVLWKNRWPPTCRNASR